MIIVTTGLAPVLLRKAYDKESPEEVTTGEYVDAPDYNPSYPLE